MHTALLDRSIEAFDAVRKHISFSANLRNQVATPGFGCKADGEKCFDIGQILGDAADATSWRVIDHCAAITGTYALFESFVLQILREYLAFLSGAYTLSALGADFKAKYTRGVGQILLDQDKQRYQNLDIASVIRAASDAMADIVDYRNEAAHGDVDDVLGTEVLIEFTHFFEALCRSIVDFIQYDTLRRAKELGRATVVGVISERFRNDIVVAKVTNATISVGDGLYIFGKGLALMAEVKSIQLNDVDVQTVTIVDETEVGLRIGVRAKAGCELVRLS